jgi:hypothetical protein
VRAIERLGLGEIAAMQDVSIFIAEMMAIVIDVTTVMHVQRFFLVLAAPVLNLVLVILDADEQTVGALADFLHHAVEVRGLMIPALRVVKQHRGTRQAVALGREFGHLFLIDQATADGPEARQRRNGAGGQVQQLRVWNIVLINYKLPPRPIVTPNP